jgi:isocitrate lyase
METPTPDL